MGAERTYVGHGQIENLGGTERLVHLPIRPQGQPGRKVQVVSCNVVCRVCSECCMHHLKSDSHMGVRSHPERQWIRSPPPSRTSSDSMSPKYFCVSVTARTLYAN